MTAPGCLNDDDFGPVVKGCRDDFDFTLKFELLIFSLVPCSIFILAAFLRCGQLFDKKTIVEAQLCLAIKLLVLIVFTVLQLSRLVFLAISSGEISISVTLASGALGFLASLLAVPLSYLEHGKSRRPSMVLSIYLFLTLLLDTAHARTLWLSATSRFMDTNTKIFTATVALKFIALLSESQQKTAWLHEDLRRHSPEESSGFFDLSMFTWLKRLFMAGYASVLTMDNLYNLDEDLSSDKMSRRLHATFDRSVASGSRFYLAKALSKALLMPLVMPVLPRLVFLGFTLSQPFFLAAVLSAISPDGDDSAKRDGFGLIGAAVVIYIGIALSRALYGYLMQRSVTMARGCLVTAVYEKTVQLEILAGDDAAAITLMSTDIERVLIGLGFLHDTWAGILQAGFSCWLLQRKLGIAFLAPVVVVLCCSIIIACVSRAATRTQAAWMTKIQSRVGMTSKVITHIKQIKISGIAQPVERFVQALRVEELAVGNKFRLVLVLTATVALAPQALSAMLAFAVAGRRLDVSTMYQSLSYMVLLATPLASFFQRMPAILSAFTCLQRIQRYLETEPRRDFRITTLYRRLSETSSVSTPLSHTQRATTVELRRLSTSTVVSKSDDIMLSISNGCFGWKNGQMILNDINIALRATEIAFVIGPVACGKSTLCKAILGDVPIAAGEVKLHPSASSVAFCDQVPFLVSGTLQQNIVGHLTLDQTRYDEAIWAAALTEDVGSLPHGHSTDIGTNGTTLSGGQKARLSLARALYNKSSLLVLDDIFSGLDNTTAARVFDRTFGPAGLLRRRGSTALVCTHSMRHISLADHVIVLSPHGSIIEQGPYRSLMHNRVTVEAIASQAAKPELSITRIDDTAPSSQASQPSPADAIAKALDDRSRQLGDWKVYKHYLASMNKMHLVLMLIGCVLIAAGRQLPTIWVGLWATDSLNRSDAFYIGMYAMLSSFILVGVVVAAWTTYIFITIDVGRELHHRALWTVMHAPIYLFTSTDTGTITNLFSQDIAIIDSELSTYLLDFVFSFVGVIGSAIVVALASPYLAVSYPVLTLIGYCVQMFYLRTSRQLRLLDLEAKSPLYTHFLDTIKGLATIRAFGWVEDEVAHNYNLLDTSQRSAYLLAMVQHCLTLVLNLLVAFLAIGLVSLATQLRTSTGFTGASLVSLMSFGDLATGLIYCYTALETSIGAVSRLKTFSDQVHSEDQPDEVFEPTMEWPQGGSLVLQNVSASYYATFSSDTDKAVLALNNISLNINAGEKIAVCGRTGSGKSSLILFLLRLMDPTPSSNLIFRVDNVNVLTVDRTTLRSRIIAVPQECVFLPDGSSIKSNIDPTDTISDIECAAILDLVQLSSFVTSQGGLDAPMSGDHLSVGQQQLFSLGRAIYRRRARLQALGQDGGLLLLDEISSSVDYSTEMLMHDIISKEFAAYTLVAVAHRLKLMVDFVDRIVVLDRGNVLEEGTPAELLDRPDGAFRTLYHAGQ